MHHDVPSPSQLPPPLLRVREISAAPDGRDWNDVLLSEMFGVKP